MASKWEEAAKETAGAGGGARGGDFLKIADGETVVVAILGEPEVFTAKPFGPGESPKTRVLLNVFVAATKTVRILDLSAGVFQQLLAVREKFAFERFMLSIKRKGTGKATRYSILPDAELGEAQRRYLATLELPNLAAIAEASRFKGADEVVPRPQPQGAPAGLAQAMSVAADDCPF